MAQFDDAGFLVVRTYITRGRIVRWLEHFGLPIDDESVAQLAAFIEESGYQPQGKAIPANVYFHLRERAEQLAAEGGAA